MYHITKLEVTIISERENTQEEIAEMLGQYNEGSDSLVKTQITSNPSVEKKSELVDELYENNLDPELFLSEEDAFLFSIVPRTLVSISYLEEPVSVQEIYHETNFYDLSPEERTNDNLRCQIVDEDDTVHECLYSDVSAPPIEMRSGYNIDNATTFN